MYQLTRHTTKGGNIYIRRFDTGGLFELRKKADALNSISIRENIPAFWQVVPVEQ